MDGLKNRQAEQEVEILCADIGGTNARIAVIEDQDVRLLKIYPTGEVKGLADLLKRFSRDTGTALPRAAAIAAAGVVKDGVVEGTNISWDIDCRDVTEKLGLDMCLLLNDFEAAAWGLLAVGTARLVKIGGQEPEPLGTRAILGAGTGLGEAVLVRCSQGWHVLKTEGGHCSMAPRDQTGMKLLDHLMATYGHVSFERVLSGPGLVEIYSFFIRGNSRRLATLHSVPQDKRASFITGLARSRDKYGLETMDFFFKTYGEEASNLALKCLPTGGIYLTGGVTLHVMDLLLDSRFRLAFEDKGRMKEVLEKIPVFVVNETCLGLKGAGYRLMHLIGRQDPA